MIDMTGQVFGRLMVIERGATYVRPGGGGISARWRCVCECGQVTEVVSTHLRSGLTQSCGCLQKQRAAETQRRDQVTYSGAHYRVERDRGKATEHPCHDCGETAKDWSYNGTDPDELTGGQGRGCRYSLDPAHYVARCRSCHRQYDKQVAS